MILLLLHKRLEYQPLLNLFIARACVGVCVCVHARFLFGHYFCIFTQKFVFLIVWLESKLTDLEKIKFEEEKKVEELK